MLLTTPNTIGTLQRKLYAKAKKEPAYRCYALDDKISRDDVLGHAWRLVRTNRGSPGVDGISFDSIEDAMAVEMLLREQARNLRTGLYKVSGVAGWRSAHALA